MIIHYLSGNPVHDRVITAFYEGCKEEKRLVPLDQYEPSDVAVIFGVYKSKVPASFARGAVFRRQREQNLDVVVLETGYVNRGDGEAHHYAAGFNGLNGRADFRNKGMPADRREKLGTVLRPWEYFGSRVILCGQVPWDASVDHVDHRAWLLEAAQEIRRRGFECVFRPHPLATLPKMPGCSYDAGKRLLVQPVRAIVTFNSNSAVEALIGGVPVFAFDEGSMVWGVANRSWDRLHYPETPDREQWLNNLAYTQWTPDEMRDGEAWRHLFR